MSSHQPLDQLSCLVFLYKNPQNSSYIWPIQRPPSSTSDTPVYCEGFKSRLEGAPPHHYLVTASAVVFACLWNIRINVPYPFGSVCGSEKVEQHRSLGNENGEWCCQTKAKGAVSVNCIFFLLLFPSQQQDDPPSLPVGTAVSAKYKGAFCEAKVSKVVRVVKCKVCTLFIVGRLFCWLFYLLGG